MLRKLAFVFGIVFVVIGVLGFVPAITPNGFLLGYFHVNVVHNLVHLLSGAIALYVSYNSYNASRIYFQVFGIVYGLVAVLGYYYGDEHIFNVLANNIWDTGLHAVIAAVSLYLGFIYKPE